MSELGDLTANLSLNFEQFIEGLKLSEHEMEHFGEIAKEMATGLGLAFGVEKVIESIHSEIEAMNELVHSSERLNVGVNSLQAFQHSAEMVGVGLEDVTRGLAVMQKNIASAVGGNTELAGAFRMIHVQAEDIIGLKADEQFIKIAEGIRQMGTDAEKVELAKMFFGKGGVALMTLIKEGKQGLQESAEWVHYMGHDIDELSEKQIKELHDSMVYLHGVWTTLWRDMALAIAPAVKAVADAVDIMNHGVDSNWAKKYLPTFDVSTMTLQWRESGDEFAGHMKHTFEEVGDEMRETMVEAQKEFNEQLRQAKHLAEEAQSPIQKLSQEYDDATDLFNQGFLSEDTVEAIRQKLDKALNEPIEKIKKQWKDAARELTDSLLTPIEKAEQKFEEAQLMFQGGFIDEHTLVEAWEAIQDAIDKANKEAMEPFIKSQEKMMELADKFIEESASPMEKYKEKVKEITDLWMSWQTGGIGLDNQQAAAAITKAAEEYKKAIEGHKEAKSDFKSVGLQQGSKEDLESIVSAITRGRPKDPHAQTAQHTQQIAQHTATISQTTAQIQYSLKGIKTWDLGG